MGTDDRIRKIAEHYGYESQSHQLTEKMGELLQAMNKFYRLLKMQEGAKVSPVKLTPIAALHAIAEEIADVTICLEQVAVLTGLEREVMRVKEEKIQRELQRMEVGENG
jgi:NTP pyrophosphatase (non-canonical NTP hydrolase)